MYYGTLAELINSHDETLIAELTRNFREAALSAADRAMLEYADKLTREPWDMTERDVVVLREQGFTDAAILDVNQVTGYYAFANRLADGLGISLEAIHEDDREAD